MTIQKYRHEDGHGAYLKDPEGEVVFVEDHEEEVEQLQSKLASLRAILDRESEIYENTKNDLRNRLHTATQRAERAERVVAQWVELCALLVDDPAEAARRLDVLRDQERWSREPDVDSRRWDDETESE